MVISKKTRGLDMVKVEKEEGLNDSQREQGYTAVIEKICFESNRRGEVRGKAREEEEGGG